MLYDAHSHIDLMQEEELLSALASAKEARINSIISCATNFPSNEKNLELAKKHPLIKPAIGLYPLDAVEFSELEIDKAFYFFKAEIKNAIAIGEVGLDYKYSRIQAEQDKQGKIFDRFIELSKEANKPLIIHSRFAQRQVLNSLEKNSSLPAMLHSFTDSLKLMKKAGELGHYVSCGINVLWSKDVQNNIQKFPIERILFETDSPIRFNNEKAMPEKIVSITEKVAQLKEMSVKDVEERVEKNFIVLFKQ
jgi:TatD DNase family protein